ncbi:conserved hypothetical protein [Talaromyces stipitatus ATCC 10500]|uniref:Uncharacterized protein n=1 Tax=Talaromyces stipitatus (strain ATCC 10500 / CBS 375.48 / QM 6759 / NRRL 1006) TaxID=441959 RepID=B8MF83_TALSN|nr:uncharacterized protein TSTA_012890 [Talaromyces stipitatus ATCC 10500]EED16182.1 conserved hypothetical protein [Talaromyces stipitatus ATCC 10500]
MQLTVLLGFLVYLGQATPTPEVPAEETKTLEQRSTGVWLDVYHEGNCNSGWEDQPNSGWVWSGQCKNFESFTYGARLGQVDLNKGQVEWQESCTLKFWENADCHGKATVHHVKDTGTWKQGNGPFFYMAYNCFATANTADGSFHLQNGAASVLMTCKITCIEGD